MPDRSELNVDCVATAPATLAARPDYGRAYSCLSFTCDSCGSQRTKTLDTTGASLADASERCLKRRAREVPMALGRQRRRSL